MDNIQEWKQQRRVWRVGRNPNAGRVANAIGVYWRAVVLFVLSFGAVLLSSASASASAAQATAQDMAALRLQSIDLQLSNINKTVGGVAIDMARMTERMRSYDAAQGQSLRVHNDHEKRIRDLEGFRATLIGAVMAAGGAGGGLGALISELLRRRAKGRREDG